MHFNSSGILSKRTTRYTIPHLKAAESGGKAPVVEIENTLASVIGARIEGGIDTLMAPGKTVMGFFK